MFAISRRILVLRGSASAAGFAGALLARGAFAAPATLPAFRLVACDRCAACQACRRHAENKLFASVKAADANRAHPGCNCGIAKASPLPRRTWLALFGPPDRPRRLVVDRRRAEVARLLG
ncbi:MAG: hypothetical protein QOF73_3431 [Thermomicrobiales bacterium]|nr:hypothetical protein [Thermomicrobiales bacterium]